LSEKLREPKESKLITGEYSPMSGRYGVVHHFNIFLYVREALTRWLEKTFGCELDNLSGSDGVPVVITGAHDASEASGTDGDSDTA